MDANPVDPRDISIEWGADSYRVYLWSVDGGACEEHELSEVDDAREVFAWADARADGRVPEIFVRDDHSPDRGLIRISGRRPGNYSHEIHVSGEVPPHAR